VEFPESAKKMVACSADRRAPFIGLADRAGWGIGAGSIYLYLVLMKKRRKQIEALAAIALLLLIIGRWERSWYWVFAAGAVFASGVLWRDFAEVLRRGWMKLAEGIGFVTGKILLFLVFVLILIPVAVYARRSGKLNIRIKKDGQTGFKERNHLYGKKDFENPW
jgi:hypothetical protein